MLSAPAKVNLYLGVGARRADGYHDVETVLQTLSLSDTVVIEPAEDLSVACDTDLGLPAEENLAYRAALALAEALGREPGACISLTKRIPAGGGLGGASSDAAAVLVGLARLWGYTDPGDDGATEVVLHEVAASLGADVPFFLGGGTALFGGRGDVLTSRYATPRLDIALVKPDEPVPTGAAYAAFDRLLLPTPPGPGAVADACAAGDARGLARVLYNNMTEASVSLVPAVGDVLGWSRSAGGVLGAAVAGSGSTVFAVCESGASALRVVEEARCRGWWAEAAESRVDGVRACSAGGER